MLTPLVLFALLNGPGTSDGAELLCEVAERLKTDRELLDTVTIETNARGTALSIRYELILGAEGSGRLSRGNVTAVVDEEWASVTHARKPGLYFVTELDGSSVGQLLGLTNSPAALVPQLGLRLAEDAEAAVSAFASSWEDEVALKSAGRIESEGRKFDEVVLSHLEGEERILIDPETRRIVRQTVRRGGQELTIHHQWQVLETPARKFEFDPGDRKLASELLFVLTVSPGDSAPPFEAAALAGGRQSLEQALADSVVVLDFWATWCRPCRKGLKEIQQFVTSAEGADGIRPKVQVFAVNVSERLEGEQRIQAVREFWERNGYTFPVLIDPDDSLRQAYGAAEIPLTVVISRAGLITAVHEESKRDLVDWLKTATAEAASPPR